MAKRTIVAAGTLLTLVHCGGQTNTASVGDGTDAAVNGSSGATSSGGSSGASSSSGSSGGLSSSGSSGGPSSSSGGMPDSGGDGACFGRTTFDAGPRGTPAQHRAQATACAPSVNHCPNADGGGQACATNADCTPDGSFTQYAACLHGQCGIDSCLADSDCPATQVCSCSSAYYGGNGCYHPNLCVPASCHVDSDCGPGGFCSPSAGTCGVVEGFYCHKLTDPCFDATADCACTGQFSNACVYAPTVGEFVCGGSVCGG